MPVKLNSELAAFFETGDQPSQTEFGHLIDSILPIPVVLPDASSTALAKATYQGRTLVVPNVSQASTYTMEVPAAAGEWYKFVYGGAAADASDHIFTMTTALYKGGVIWHNGITNDNSDDAVDNIFSTSVYADASNDVILTLNTPEIYEINFLALSTTVVYVWGYIDSLNAPVFS